jgi:hypothetical protein
VPDDNEDGDHFGATLAAGDFNGDGRSDLAIGAPDEDIAGYFLAGTLTVLYGSATGISASSAQFWTQGDLGSPNFTEQSENWTTALAVGDSNGDGRDDLFISAPNEEIESPVFIANAGVVNKLLGSSAGLAGSNPIITQETQCAGNSSETGDRFGDLLSLGDFDGNGDADLAVGTPQEDIGAFLDAGMVCVAYGRSGPSRQTWTQDSPGVLDTAENDDFFGGGLDSSAGRDNHTQPDLAHLITAHFDLDTPINKLNKRRNLSGRR